MKELKDLSLSELEDGIKKYRDIGKRLTESIRLLNKYIDCHKSMLNSAYDLQRISLEKLEKGFEDIGIYNGFRHVRELEKEGLKGFEDTEGWNLDPFIKSRNSIMLIADDLIFRMYAKISEVENYIDIHKKQIIKKSKELAEQYKD